MDFELNTDYYLSTEGFFFRYREDKYNPATIRAELFNTSGEIVDKLLVKGGIINTEFKHSDVINAFEYRVNYNNNR